VVLFGTLAGTALYGVVGAIFAVPIVAIIAATVRYMKGTLIFERWGTPLLKRADEKREDGPPTAAASPEAGRKGDGR
jgi:hypothetical protein